MQKRRVALARHALRREPTHTESLTLRHLSIAIAAILCVIGTAPGASHAHSAAAATEWVFSSSPDACTVIGRPGEAFVLLTINPEGEQGLRIHHRDLVLGNGEVRPLVLTVGETRLAFDVTGARTVDGTPGFIVGARRDLRAAFGAGTAAVVEIAPGAPLALDLSGLSEVLAPLDACAAQLKPRDLASIAVSKPVLKKMPSMTASEMPLAGATRNEVGFRLTVSPEGRAVGCEIVKSSGSDRLDAKVCEKLIAGTRFTPARNAAGNPVAATYQSSMVFRR